MRRRDKAQLNTNAAPNELKLGESGYKTMSDVGGCSSGIVWGKQIVGLELLSASGYVHTLFLIHTYIIS